MNFESGSVFYSVYIVSLHGNTLLSSATVYAAERISTENQLPQKRLQSTFSDSSQRPHHTQEL
jgi:hypothetical protein